MKYTKDILEEAVKNSFSISGVLRQLGMAGGGSHGHITRRIKELGIDTSHFKPLEQSLKGLNPKKPWQEILVLSSRDRRTQAFLLRRALMEMGREYKCENNKCLVQNEWLGNKLVLDIDHINGNWKDNRPENLRFLCPNCHRQTETYGSKPRVTEPNNYIAHQNKRVPHMKARKVERLSKEELEKMIWEKPTTSLAKEFGVSGKAIEKWCKTYGVQKPPRGYWSRNKNY
jgi:hypothetical protein